MEVNIVDDLETEMCTLQVVDAHCATRLSGKLFSEKLSLRFALIRNPPLGDSKLTH